MKILFIAGHGQGDSGAVGNGYLESDLTRELLNLTYNIGVEKGLNIEVYNTDLDCYQQSLKGNVPNYQEYNYVLEFHFNAFNGQAFGTEILVHPSESGVGVEEEILRGFVKLGFITRGIKRRSDLLNLNNCIESDTSYALLETCFIDNENDMNLYKNNKTQIASYIIEGIIKGFEIEYTKPAPTTREQIVTNDYDAYAEDGQAVICIDVINIRNYPSKTASIVGTYSNGESFNYDYVIINNEGVWVRYTSFSGQIRYVCVKQGNERYANCY